ncbi:hypothetical protein BD410DRAFT_785935 [Rickenella mellea]|uniref:Uncharacterized protein n=1 Tax=Rickenella mellea TaxID=50990 RepID=A0A4Y7QBM0_9AGAM|nr:hypothetical protein BD410DRAFT_785935 [Rickenella mellea]
MDHSPCRQFGVYGILPLVVTYRANSCRKNRKMGAGPNQRLLNHFSDYGPISGRIYTISPRICLHNHRYGSVIIDIDQNPIFDFSDIRQLVDRCHGRGRDCSMVKFEIMKLGVGYCVKACSQRRVKRDHEGNAPQGYALLRSALVSTKRLMLYPKDNQPDRRCIPRFSTLLNKHMTENSTDYE